MPRAGRSAREEGVEQVRCSLPLSRGEIEDLDRAASAAGVSRSAWIRGALYARLSLGWPGPQPTGGWPEGRAAEEADREAPNPDPEEDQGD